MPESGRQTGQVGGQTQREASSSLPPKWLRPRGVDCGQKEAGALMIGRPKSYGCCAIAETVGHANGAPRLFRNVLSPPLLFVCPLLLLHRTPSTFQFVLRTRCKFVAPSLVCQIEINLSCCCHVATTDKTANRQTMELCEVRVSQRGDGFALKQIHCFSA